MIDRAQLEDHAARYGQAMQGVRSCVEGMKAEGIHPAALIGVLCEATMSKDELWDLLERLELYRALIGPFTVEEMIERAVHLGGVQ